MLLSDKKYWKNSDKSHLENNYQLFPSAKANEPRDIPEFYGNSSIIFFEERNFSGIRKSFRIFRSSHLFYSSTSTVHHLEISRVQSLEISRFCTLEISRRCTVEVDE